MIANLTVEDIRAVATWPLVIEAIREGHRNSKADVGDTFVHAGDNTMLVRSAYVDGVAAGVKAATVVPQNSQRTPPLPSIHAQVLLFDPDTGQLTATLDGTEITPWKTAADSALGCDLLSRPDSRTLLMVGAGIMAEPLVRAHLSVRPNLETILLWNRTAERAERLANNLADLPLDVQLVSDLDAGVARADIVSSATMTNAPLIKGEVVRPGAHVDLVGAFKADMREADDDLHQCASWFVDSMDTTFGHIGEFVIPHNAGLIDQSAIKGDLHDLVSGKSGRNDNDQITVFKNGGGAHLDIMVSAALVEAHLRQSQ